MRPRKLMMRPSCCNQLALAIPMTLISQARTKRKTWKVKNQMKALIPNMKKPRNEKAL